MRIHPRNHRNELWAILGLAALLPIAAAQTAPESSSALQQILDRLDRLERQNRQLTDEVHALRNELAVSRSQSASGPADGAQAADLGEKVEVQERRIEEQAQTKVEASQHLPVRITGMALFNAFLNSHPDGG